MSDERLLSWDELCLEIKKIEYACIHSDVAGVSTLKISNHIAALNQIIKPFGALVDNTPLLNLPDCASVDVRIEYVAAGSSEKITAMLPVADFREAHNIFDERE